MGERFIWPFGRIWSIGHATPVDKVFWTAIRKPGLSFAEFNDEWAGPHARLAIANRRFGTRTTPTPPGERYIQNVVLSRGDDRTPVIDGIVESVSGPVSQDAESVRRMRQALEDPQDESARHTQTFIDTSKMD